MCFLCDGHQGVKVYKCHNNAITKNRVCIMYSMIAHDCSMIAHDCSIKSCIQYFPGNSN